MKILLKRVPTETLSTPDISGYFPFAEEYNFPSRKCIPLNTLFLTLLFADAAWAVVELKFFILKIYM